MPAAREIIQLVNKIPVVPTGIKMHQVYTL
jgi:hypothetical protein